MAMRGSNPAPNCSLRSATPPGIVPAGRRGHHLISIRSDGTVGGRSEQSVNWGQRLFPANAQLLFFIMDEIREQGPTGHVLATSVDGSTFLTAAGALFAERLDDVFRMADGSVGMLIGAVVFVQNQVGAQTPAYWLEPVPDTSE